MARKIVIGNMKTKSNYEEILTYVEEIKKLSYSGLILMPTSLYMPFFLNTGIKLGVQNIFYENTGSYTGEILPSQAKSMGIRYALVGHSERRKYLKESNQIINKKVIAGLEAKMGVVLCIGEDMEDKLKQETESVLKRQLFTALKGVEDLKNLVIAYEPVWAIGSGKTPTKRELKMNIKCIKDFIKTFTDVDVKVLYGGSVDSSNIENFLSIDTIDGFLIGGASNDASELKKIISIIKSFS